MTFINVKENNNLPPEYDKYLKIIFQMINQIL